MTDPTPDDADLDLVASGLWSMTEDGYLLTMWGRFPLATTLYLRERFRAYRAAPGDPSQPSAT